MSTYRKKGSTIYTMDFWFNGTRIVESTKVRTKQAADAVERARHTALEHGRAGIPKPRAVPLFAAAAAEYMEAERATLPPGVKTGRAATVHIDSKNLKHLLPAFGKLLVCNISPLDVAKYQKARTEYGAAPTTINNEMGTFRSIMTPNDHWARLLSKINPTLEVDYEVGRCLTTEEIDAILEACWMSESRLLFPIVTLLLETGARSGTVLKLPWGEIDFEGRGLRWGKDKTKAGTGRTIPISQRAMSVLDMWKDNFPKRKPHHFVFASERYRQPKDEERGIVSPYKSDPTKHVTSVQHSWVTAQERAAWILAGRPAFGEPTGRKGGGRKGGTLGGTQAYPPFHCRFHDLRHTACTRMIVAKTPIPVVAQLVGWSATTMWAMAKKYGHFSQEDMREAVESIATSGGSHLKSHLFSTPHHHTLS